MQSDFHKKQVYFFTSVVYILLMILYNPDCSIPLSDFGILIPIRYDKQEMVYRSLKDGALKNSDEKLWRAVPPCSGILREDLLRVHSTSYTERLFSDRIEEEVIRTFELIDSGGNFNRYDPKSAVRPLKDLLRRALSITRGTYAAGALALQAGFAYFLGGGMHHAMRDYGSGFCLVNDIVIALRRLQAEGRIATAWIIDLDAHKGDGTAALTRGDDSLRTLSIHMADGWPLDAPEYDPEGKFNPSYTPSDVDIGMRRGEDEHYNTRLREGLGRLAEFCPRPDLALIVDGSDPYEKDELASTASLALTKEMLLERDLMVYDLLRERGIPGAWIMAGGYGALSWGIYVNFLSRVLPLRFRS